MTRPLSDTEPTPGMWKTYTGSKAIRRLLALHGRASAEMVRDGTAWYTQAREWVNKQADNHNLTRGLVAGAVAILSPMVDWSYQIKTQIPTFLGRLTGRLPIPPCGRASADLSGLAGNFAKAQLLLETGDVRLISGPKVSRFFRNLLGCNQTVTVDTWGIRAATGWPLSLTPSWFRENRLAALEKAYRHAARRVGMAPAPFQATIWLQIKSEDPQ